LKSVAEVRQFGKQNLKIDQGQKFIEEFLKRKSFSQPVQKVETIDKSASSRTPQPSSSQVIKPLDQSPKPNQDKKEKKKGVPLNPALLGFSVNSGRIMQGEIQSLE